MSYMADRNKKSLNDLDEIDKAIIRDLLARELVSLELEFPGTTSENTENLTRLRSLYAFFMRGGTRTFHSLRARMK